MYDLPDTTTVSVGVATKPYPSWRLPGKKKTDTLYVCDTNIDSLS